MNSTPGTVTVDLYHTHWGQSRMRVQYLGHRKSVAYDYSSHDPFLSAMLDVLGRGVRVQDSDRKHGQNRIVFYIDPRTASNILPDYMLSTYADGAGRWSCRIDFTYGAGNTGEGERLISNARRAAQRAIRSELIARGDMNSDHRLSYEVTENASAGSGALTSLTISEA